MRDLEALVPPIAAAPLTMAATGAMVRAVVVEPGLVDRVTKEAVAAAVAYRNGCSSCEELHLTALEALNRRRIDCELSALADARVRRVTEWARSPGLPRPFPDGHVPELVGTVVVSHYLNRMVLVLSDRTSDSPAEVDALPAGELPADLGWARGRSSVARAFGQAAAVLGDGVPASVRAVVSGRVAEWRGEMPADDAWLGGALSGLADGEVAVGRLAVVAALTPGRVDPVLVDVVRERWGQRVLADVVAWAAFEAARRIGTLLAADAGPAQEDEAKVIPFRRRNPGHRPLSAAPQRQAKL